MAHNLKDTRSKQQSQIPTGTCHLATYFSSVDSVDIASHLCLTRDFPWIHKYMYTRVCRRMCVSLHANYGPLFPLICILLFFTALRLLREHRNVGKRSWRILAEHALKLPLIKM